MSSASALLVPTTNDTLIWDIWMSEWHLPAMGVAVELGVFAALKDGGKSMKELFDHLKITARAGNALIATLLGLKLLTHRMDVLELTDSARLFLLKDSPFDWTAMTHRQTNAFTQVLHSVKSDQYVEDATSMKAWENPLILTDEQAKTISASMQAHSLPASVGVARNVDWSKHKRLLDIGGGSGCFCISVVQQHPSVHATVAELPPVCKAAKEYIKKAGVDGRADTCDLNMFLDKWPTDYDAHFFSNVLHDWDMAACTVLLKNSFAALPPGGKIYLHEMLLNDNFDGPLTTACFSLLMLTRTKGQQFTAPQLKGLLASVGFQQFRVVNTYGYYSVLSATKP